MMLLDYFDVKRNFVVWSAGETFSAHGPVRLPSGVTDATAWPAASHIIVNIVPRGIWSLNASRRHLRIEGGKAN